MSQVSFYPGPSRIYSNVTEYIYEAYMSGLLSANHRSEPFMDLMRETADTLKRSLLIPDDYLICYVSSATECWEIIAQSLVRDRISIAYNGSFGEKWAGYTSAIIKDALSISFDLEHHLPVDELLSSKSDVLGLVQSETSNGTAVDMNKLEMLRKQASEDTLIAVDATSSMGGIHLDFKLADVWYASVQKCLGLPSGLGVLILSPRAIDRAFELNRNEPYNALTRIIENAQKNQTHYTPNILNIYLLNRTQDQSRGIEKQHTKTLQRYDNWREIIDSIKQLDWLVSNKEQQSPTILALKVEKPNKLKKAALDKGFIVGNGYGPWKESTIRIANFPALKGKEIEKLTGFLERYFR